jgi:thioester reductase-like protein
VTDTVVRAKKSVRVFLTGCTGFLGAHVLQQVLQRPNTKVVCLVRGADGQARLRETLTGLLIAPVPEIGAWGSGARVEVVRGSIETDRFGSEDAWAAARSSNVLIHSAAHVSFAASDQELRETNVNATARMLQAAQGRKLVYVSSLSVFDLLHGGDVGSPFELVPPEPRNPYARSKWLGEHACWAAKRNGESVVVVRPGCIMGNSLTGASNQKDWFAGYLAACVGTGLSFGTDQRSDMTPVDSVAELCAALGLDALDATVHTMRAWHAMSSANIMTKEINAVLGERGIQVQMRTYAEFFGAIQQVAARSKAAARAALPFIELLDSVFWEREPMKAVDGADFAAFGITPVPATVLLRKMLDFFGIGGKGVPAAKQAAALAQQALPPTLAAGFEAAAEESLVTTVASQPSGVGIVAMELYVPRFCVTQADMEKHDNCEGKYTSGLLQKEIGFGTDDEDAVSYALTAVARLLERVGPQVKSKIGRIEVGTESQVDRSKAIKTFLMQLFDGHQDVEGVDNVNACYGGTAALLNTLAWAETAGKGRYAIVVATDIANQDERYRFMTGAACVAMLVGPGGGVVLEERASACVHTWDFYKPVGWPRSSPCMPDGRASVEAYLGCLDACAAGLEPKIPAKSVIENCTHAVFHCTSAYLCKRGFEHLYKRHATQTKTSVSLKARQAAYESMTAPSTKVTVRNGSAYTAACYVGLYCLLEACGTPQGRIAVYSYGSGSMSTLFVLKPGSGTVSLGQSTDALLDRRTRVDPKTFLHLSGKYADSYKKFDWSPELRADREPGVFYLTNVDKEGHRTYERHS